MFRWQLTLFLPAASSLIHHSCSVFAYLRLVAAQSAAAACWSIMSGVTEAAPASGQGPGQRLAGHMLEHIFGSVRSSRSGNLCLSHSKVVSLHLSGFNLLAVLSVLSQLSL